MGLNQHAGLRDGAILGHEQAIGVLAGKAQEGGYRVVQGFLLRDVQVWKFLANTTRVAPPKFVSIGQRRTVLEFHEITVTRFS